MLKHTNNKNEFNDIIKEGTWIVDFFATWCGPCKMLGPVMEEASEKHNVLKIDVDEAQDLAMEYGIMSVPSVLIFKDGKKVNQHVGYMTLDEVEEMLNKLLFI